MPDRPPSSEDRSEARRLADALAAAGVPPEALGLAAISGGPDSLLLLHLLAEARDEGRLCAPIVATVNHRLRPESGADVATVRAACESLGLVFHELEGRLPEEPGASIEDAARRVRYRVLAKLARELGAQMVLTAHQADDQAETLLWRLVSGAPIVTLRGMRAARSLDDGLLLVRPLLAWTRAEVQQAVDRRDLEPRHDASNDDPRFLRHRLRRIVGELREINPRATEALAEAAERIGELLDVVGDAERRLLSELGVDLCEPAPGEPARRELRVPAAPLRRARPAVRDAALRRLLQRLGLTSGRRAVDRLAELCGADDAGLARLSLAGGEAARCGAELRIRAREPASGAASGARIAGQETVVKLPIPGSVAFRGTRYHVRRLPRGEAPEPDADPRRLAVLDARVGASLTIRRRRPGDRLRPLGQRSGEQTVGRLMKSRGIPADRRDEFPVLLAGDRIVWVIGVEVDDRACVREDTEDVLEIRIEADSQSTTH